MGMVLVVSYLLGLGLVHGESIKVIPPFDILVLDGLGLGWEGVQKRSESDIVLISVLYYLNS